MGTFVLASFSRFGSGVDGFRASSIRGLGLRGLGFRVEGFRVLATCSSERVTSEKKLIKHGLGFQKRTPWTLVCSLWVVFQARPMRKNKCF